MTSLRVLHVAAYGPAAWAYGGIPRVVGAQIAGLARRGVDVTLATTDACGAAERLGPGSTPSRGPAVEVFANRSNLLAYRWQLFLPRGMGRWLRRHAGSFQVAHLHGCHHLPGALAARALRRSGVPYLLQPNGTAARIERRRTAKWLFDHTLGRGVLAGAAATVAVSDAERRQLRDVLGRDERSIPVVPNPIDPAELDAEVPTGRFRRELGLTDETLLVFLGRITPRKRVDLLVQALDELPGVHLAIVGNDGGGLPAARRQVALLGLEKRVHTLGLRTGARRLEALTDADVVVYPSEDEAFGLVALEAAMCGTPTVVADDSGCGELVRQLGGGLLFRAGDRCDLAATLVHALRERDGLVLAIRAARAAIRERFSADAVAARLEELYLGLAGIERCRLSA